jgi:hypothetical protein
VPLLTNRGKKLPVSVWLTDLSTRLPKTVRLEGLDISFAAAHPIPWLPDNVTLHHWDIREAIVPSDSDLCGAYDVVHVRNLAFVLRDDDVPSVLVRLVSLLRPGGYLQWGEPDVSSFRIETVPSNDGQPKVTTDALSHLLALSQPQDGRLSHRLCVRRRVCRMFRRTFATPRRTWL